VTLAIPSQRLVDPVLPQLPAIRLLAATDTHHRLPVVLPFQADIPIHATVRGNILLAYKPLGIYEAQGVATVLLTPEQGTACEINAIFVALQTALALSATSGDRVSELISAYPELDDLLISPDNLCYVALGSGPRSATWMPRAPPRRQAVSVCRRNGSASRTASLRLMRAAALTCRVLRR